MVNKRVRPTQAVSAGLRKSKVWPDIAHWRDTGRVLP